MFFLYEQSIIGNYAVPILEENQVWGTSDTTKTAYLDTLDVARIILASLRYPTNLVANILKEIVLTCNSKSTECSYYIRQYVGSGAVENDGESSFSGPQRT